MVFSIADPMADALLINRNVKWLEEAAEARQDQRKFKGSWGYPEGYGDNSNSQFAVLALYEAQLHRRSGQHPDLAAGPAVLGAASGPTARGATSRTIPAAVAAA